MTRDEHDLDQIVSPEIPVGGALGRPKLRTRLTAKYGQPFCWGQCLELQAGRVVPITKIKENVGSNFSKGSINLLILYLRII